jgi:hypothetical protein
MEIKDVFEVLSKGYIISNNSKKFENYARFLSDDENFDELNRIVNKLGFYLVGENGYYYLSKPLSLEESDKFFNSHKDVILAIALVKRLFIHLDVSHKIKQSDFIIRYKDKEDSVKDIAKALFKSEDVMEIKDKLFNLLERNFVFERLTTDEYFVLNSFNYYVDIVESLGGSDE